MHLTRPSSNLGRIASLQFVPGGKLGTLATLKHMRLLVRDAKVMLPIRELAVSIVQHLPPKDWPGELRAVQNWVRSNIRYVRDINDVETLHRPIDLLAIGSGDCDDMSMLTAALLESIGHPTRFRAIGFVPDEYDHVFPESRLNKGWVSVETTENVDIGWEPPGVVSNLIIHN